MGTIRVTAPAKVNLHLEVLGLRGDGFHELAMVMQSIDLADRLGFTNRSDAGLHLSCDDPTLSIGNDNLVVRAAELLRERSGFRELGATIQAELRAFAEQLRDERELAIWNERLVSEDPISLALLGERYGVSKERIRQIEARIRKRLKAHLSASIGDDLAFEFDVPEEA